MILRVLSRYRNGTVDYEEGTEVHVKDDEGEFLLRDSPGSFEVVDAQGPAAENVHDDAAGGVDRKERGGRSR